MGALVSCFSAAEEALIHEQALAALLAQQNGGVLPFDRSSSLRYPGHGQKKQALQRSSSWRATSLTDPVVQPQHFVNQQDLKIDNLETNHFVLIHGGGFGAWCWYKTKALLEDCGFKVNAIDLTGSGIHSFDTNKITTLPEYVQPLTSFLEALGDGEKVILVGHDFGGACISYAMEMFPSKIATAVFLCAAMLTSGQSTLDMFSQQACGRAEFSVFPWVLKPEDTGLGVARPEGTVDDRDLAGGVKGGGGSDRDLDCEGVPCFSFSVPLFFFLGFGSHPWATAAVDSGERTGKVGRR